MADSFTTEKNGQTNVARDERELLDQLLEPEVQESLTVLVKELPKLTELVKILSSSYDTVQSLASDEVLKRDTVEFMSEVAEPLKASAKEVAQNAIEAKDQADNSSEVIGLFGLMKMLKDPQAQKMFRFINAYLKVSAERNHKE
ncbi:DUF1641 domain-containing protein [Halobacillus karajensis]|uniref:DUF1641 domain-containing protein n=1 Tax=Halobacillus karajensis TaxID=195088 RepID=A0A024P4Q1_9BACI|nr:DUF1641 domain-containing protein [Halobacillus karajensis]CDQ20670.1 hypothetical protein BN982_03023 [Halobacillus karajensis]CDQ23860.1 hypothetical protein BN983_02113 [Halobacillus karajensis]CDQ27338.1 hypothetical protein BN981_01594 [Halobacillus karajensis]